MLTWIYFQVFSYENVKILEDYSDLYKNYLLSFTIEDRSSNFDIQFLIFLILTDLFYD